MFLKITHRKSYKKILPVAFLLTKVEKPRRYCFLCNWK